MGYVVKQYTLQSSGYQEPLALTISLSLTTISSIYLVSVCTEGLRTLRLDRRRPPDACCSLTWSGLSSSSPSPPLPSHSLSSVQSGHIKKQSCRQLGKYYFLRKIKDRKLLAQVGFKQWKIESLRWPVIILLIFWNICTVTRADNNVRHCKFFK